MLANMIVTLWYAGIAGLGGSALYVIWDIASRRRGAE